MSPDSEVTTDLSVLTFDPATNWVSGQTVTVTAVEDADVEGNHTGIIGHTSISDVTANITDNAIMRRFRSGKT